MTLWFTMQMNDFKDYESKKLKHMMVQLLEQQQEQLKLLQEKEPEQIVLHLLFPFL